MPYRLEHIDAIARTEGRDALYIRFPALWSFENNLDDETLPIRMQIIEWLEAAGISWQPCGEWASESSMVSYLGSIYIDVPYDEANPTYQKVRDYLENPDGTMRYSDAMFCYVPLELAMKNAHHDEPGFWERWAKNF